MKRFAGLLLILSLLVPGIAAQETDEPIITRSTAPDPAALALQPMVEGLRRPLYITYDHAQSERLFIVEQGGVIRVLDGSTISVFLDVSAIISPDANNPFYSERGLLGLAFHPNYAENGRFFINYTDRNGDTVVARYSVSDDPLVADSASAAIIFQLEQPYANHNGGHMVFGPDGYLYVGLGDGGQAGDPLRAGQNPATLLGTIIRIDVDNSDTYAIPADNPFAVMGDMAAAPEVWAYGLRNPWRFSFDRATGDMYIGDVGQNRYEEVNFQPAGEGGLNYGWNAFEASAVFDQRIEAQNPVAPFAEYAHDLGCSVTGGYLYRGEAIPDLQGVYLYGDYCSGNVWAAYRDENGDWQDNLFLETGMQISSFGEAADGELFIIDYRGTVYSIVPAA